MIDDVTDEPLENLVTLLRVPEPVICPEAATLLMSKMVVIDDNSFINVCWFF
jgi:hypothetical protein